MFHDTLKMGKLRPNLRPKPGDVSYLLLHCETPVFVGPWTVSARDGTTIHRTHSRRPCSFTPTYLKMPMSSSVMVISETSTEVIV